MDYSLRKCPWCNHMSLRAVDNTEFYAVAANRKHAHTLTINIVVTRKRR